MPPLTRKRKVELSAQEAGGDAPPPPSPRKKKVGVSKDPQAAPSEALEDDDPDRPTVVNPSTASFCVPEAWFHDYLTQNLELPEGERLGISPVLHIEGFPMIGTPFNAVVMALMNSAYFLRYLDWFEERELLAGDCMVLPPLIICLMDIRSAYWDPEPDQKAVDKAMHDFFETAKHFIPETDPNHLRWWMHLANREPFPPAEFLAWMFNVVEQELCGRKWRGKDDPVAATAGPNETNTQTHFNALLGNPLVTRETCRVCGHARYKSQRLNKGRQYGHVLNLEVPLGCLPSDSEPSFFEKWDLKDCISDNFDALEDWEGEKCSRCKSTTGHDVLKRMLHAPELLIVNIDRLKDKEPPELQEMVQNMLTNPTSIPETLEMDPWLEPEVFGKGGQAHYRLTAIIQHREGAAGGYVTDARQINVKPTRGGKTPWRSYNDEFAIMRDLDDCNDSRVEGRHLEPDEWFLRPEVLLYEKYHEYRDRGAEKVYDEVH